MKCMKTAICDECQKTLAFYGELCLDACHLACLSMTTGEMETFNPDKDTTIAQVVEFLEKKMYLTSSEVSKTQIAFLPTCEPFLSDDNILVYCWCNS